MQRNDTVICISSCNQRWWILDVHAHIMQRRVLIHKLKMLRILLRIAELGCPEPADGKFMEPEHICHRHKAKRGTEQFRTLRDTSANKESTITSTHNREPARIRILMINQPFGSSNEIIEHILLLVEDAIQMPLFSKFSATTKIRHGINTTRFQPHFGYWGVGRRQTNIVPAIPK